MDLNELLVFAKVADRLSFVQAARVLGLPASTVSRKVAALEQRLGVALLYRTTRHVRLTEAGASYHQHCIAVIAAAEEAEAALMPHRDGLRGALRVNASVSFGQRVLAPVAGAFAAAHPAIRLQVMLGNAQVTPVADGYDLVIRVGALADSSLRARRIARAPLAVVASPDCLARHGEPDSLAAVARLPCLVFGAPREARWHCGTPGEPPLDVNAVFTADDMETLREVALAGIGFALLPRFVAGREIENGLLRVLRVSSELTPVEVHAVYPGHRILTQGARGLAHFLQQRLARLPHWIGEPTAEHGQEVLKA